MKRRSRIKKFIVLSGAASIISFTLLSDLHAQTGGGPAAGSAEFYLSQISQYTYNTMNYAYSILEAVNNIPTYLGKITEMAISWLATDDTDSTAKLQGNFTALGNVIINGNTAQSVDPIQLASDMFGLPRDDFLNPQEKPAVLKVIPYINDVSYPTLIGQPLIKNAPGSSYNYVKNIAGTNIKHIIPGLAWQGSDDAQGRYLSYYMTIMAIESFNSFLLSNHYTDFQNFNTAQTELIKQATQPDWFTQIATEELGKVLRQLLMFNSQSYILQSQIIQTNKQLLAAQMMTNSLLIASNANTEKLLVAAAQGVEPTP